MSSFVFEGSCMKHACVINGLKTRITKGQHLSSLTEFKPRASSEDMTTRFWLRVQRSDNACWKWTGQKNAHGYGLLSKFGTLRLAHRISWELHHGQILSNMNVLHHCDNPSCVNPNHLFLGTHSDNMRDAKVKGRTSNQNKSLTHCKKGHEFTPDNTYQYRNHRHCKACWKLKKCRKN